MLLALPASSLQKIRLSVGAHWPLCLVRLGDFLGEAGGDLHQMTGGDHPCMQFRPAFLPNATAATTHKITGNRGLHRLGANGCIGYSRLGRPWNELALRLRFLRRGSCLARVLHSSFCKHAFYLVLLGDETPDFLGIPESARVRFRQA
jgi:hypothetical protein